MLAAGAGGAGAEERRRNRENHGSAAWRREKKSLTRKIEAPSGSPVSLRACVCVCSCRDPVESGGRLVVVVAEGGKIKTPANEREGCAVKQLFSKMELAEPRPIRASGAQRAPAPLSEGSRHTAPSTSLARAHARFPSLSHTRALRVLHQDFCFLMIHLGMSLSRTTDVLIVGVNLV